MSRQLNAIMALASLILLLGLISPPSTKTSTSIFVQAGVIPGRILNSNHEEIFAQQQKELQRTKAKERKPVGLFFMHAYATCYRLGISS